MPRNGTGTYNLPQAPFVPGTVISSATMNSDLNDIATALTGSLPRDGQAGMSGALKSSDGIAGAPASRSKPTLADRNRSRIGRTDCGHGTGRTKPQLCPSAR